MRNRMRWALFTLAIALAVITAAWALPHRGWQWCMVRAPYGSFADGSCFFDDSDQTILVSFAGRRFWIGRIEYDCRSGHWMYAGVDRNNDVWAVSPYP